ncbi:MAG: hypothetical protein K0Q68_2353 [Moraxellaceae bacterium]|jgi:putative transcriptional regulator|nr:hypothetical protein [Moraxellaceae bacterium]
MIRFRLREVMAEKAFRDGKAVTINDVAAATGISRNTLSKIANEKGCSTITSNVDLLCTYFDCRVEDLMYHEKGEQ